MLLGVLHLSDIHIKDNCIINEKILSLCKICGKNFALCDHVVVIVTGDIAFSGKAEEYKYADEFFTALQENISTPRGVDIDIVLVPGNHDCDFSLSNQLRDNCVKAADYNSIGNDNSVIEICTSVQKAFFDFAAKYKAEFNPSKLFCHKIIGDDHSKVSFIGLNTSWMSSLSEQPGRIFFPIRKVIDDISHYLCDVNIVFYHHPLAWLNPQNDPNNRLECQDYLNKTFQIQLSGHEHGKATFEITQNGRKSLCFYGNEFEDESHGGKHGFFTMTIDVGSKNIDLKSYIWNGSLFCEDESNSKDAISFPGSRHWDFTLKKDFLSSILSIGIPSLFDNKNLTIRDIFVYPDLEKCDVKSKYINKNISSQDIISDKHAAKVIFLQGENQIGKTSLLRMLFYDAYVSGKTPIILSGGELIDNIDSLLKRKISEQYEGISNAYDIFIKKDLSDKILFIDDIHKYKLRPRVLNKVLRRLESVFSKIIISSGMSIDYNILCMESTSLYSIKPLGYKKTNELIEKYYCAKENATAVDNQILLQNIRNTFDQVRHVLGNKIIPSCPIFIISIVATLENSAADLSKTSYGYCYQNLIYQALVHAKVKNEEIDSYINFLKILSYQFYCNDNECMSEDELRRFYDTYSHKYFIYSYEQIKDKLLQSLILHTDGTYYTFGYKYVFYFLVAKYISDKIHTADGKKILEDLFSKIHIERCANILVFIAHHSDDVSFLDEAVFASLASFETVAPLTLNKGPGYYSQMLALADKISTTIIAETDPVAAREKSLEKADEAYSDSSDIRQDTNDAIAPFLRAFRAIDIVGQIVKNRRGSLEQKRIEQMVEELYYTAFRTIEYLGHIFDDAHAELLDSVREQIDPGADEAKIREQINLLFQFFALQSCLNVFSRLIYSVGLKDFNSVYNNVAKKIGTPAAKLVSFSINSYYNRISLIELRRLASELKDNHVAMMILRARVKAYIYYNYVDYREKQQMADILGMRVLTLPH